MTPADRTQPSPRTLTETTANLNSWIEVDIGAIEANVAAIRHRIGPGIEIIAVVKANAYGAGAEGFATALEAAGVDRFAVVWAPEAINLRRFGIQAPIVVLGHSFPSDADTCVAHDITLTVHSADLGDAIESAAAQQAKTARVHIKVDTGLHRFGVTPQEALLLAGYLRGLPHVEVEGLTTHMANADEADDSFSETQNRVFAEVASQLPWIPYRHTANSASALRRDELHYHGVRIGLALHGVLPPNTPAEGFRPALALKARLARVADVAPGEGVSYGLTWRAISPARVGLVPVGYADGWPRSLGNNESVLVRGSRAPMVGRVCMDQFLADVTSIPGAAEGDEVVLLGRQSSEEIGADEVAGTAGTISWDILASLQARLPRIYHRDGQVSNVFTT